jgi:YbbR domain-containing protein
MSTLRRLVLHNWHLKLLSLILAFLLWSVYISEPQVEIGYLVPLEFKGVSEVLEISGDVPAQVHLRLRGRSAVLRRLTPADLAVTVNLDAASAGENQLTLTSRQVDLPPGTEVVRFSPSQIRIILVSRSAPR